MSESIVESKMAFDRILYVQGGNMIQNSKSSIADLTQYNSITDEFCAAQKTIFQDTQSSGHERVCVNGRDGDDE